MLNSPDGGTTSLPQYLQKRTQTQPQTQATGATPPPATMRPLQTTANTQAAPAPKPNQGGVSLSNPKPTSGMVGGMTAPASPGMVGSQPIPPAPPPPMAPPASAGMTPGGTTVTRTATSGAPAVAPPPASGESAQAGLGLSELIKRMLGGEGRYGDQQIQDMRTASQQRLDDERRLSADRLTASANSRGMLRSSGLNTSLGDTEDRYLRGMMESEAGINKQVADAKQQDLLSAIQAAFGYGDGQQRNSAQEQNFMLALAQLGLAGGPTIPGAVGDFGSLPSPGVPGNDGFYEWLGTLFGPKAAA
jgi:hypothetical protein